MALLELRGLTKYFGGLAAVTNLDFEVARGEILGLIGPNGSGKTTTFNMISGFVKPSRGEVIFKGETISTLSPHRIASKGIRRTFQDTSLFRQWTALDNVLTSYHLEARMGFPGFWGQFLNIPSTCKREREILNRALELLRFTGLEAQKDKIAQHLSHGWQKTLSLAVALAGRAELLLLDEPVTALSPGREMALVELIKEIREKEETTIIIVEHNMRAIMNCCDRIVALNFGRKIAQGSPSEIRSHPAVIEAYLGKTR